MALGITQILPYGEHSFLRLSYRVAARKRKQTNLIRDAVKECGSPEAVNKEFDTKPSARLGRIFPGYENQKDLFEICTDSAGKLD